ncbi:hypothetical protein Nocox_05430 [Nonomuraea coxensis DSM 45129]|uniref:Excreted virulence factor EspC (Type VII ESX diderm) n=1 Tax=Nonomuraea coxensis DSM 45129 TaxID=1122611 RepID=A0ABX8TWK3_9ACTN|nr:hypothetical protein [Nonomuraea coxensis]QYC38713.1 hypothetical protein Nocox_05430 [Nonomuraea coxensis DSM 45129]
MSYVDVYMQALDDCGRQVRRVSKMLDFDNTFEDSEAQKPPEKMDSRLFGRLKGAGELAGQIDDVWGAFKAELAAGQDRLDRVERSLDKVVTNYREAEKDPTK